MEEKVSGSLDKVEETVCSDKENITSFSIQAYNIQEIWKTEKIKPMNIVTEKDGSKTQKMF